MQGESDTEPTPIRPDVDEDLRCFFCAARSVTVLDNYCHGCGVIICENCLDLENDPWGKHDPSDHVVCGD